MANQANKSEHAGPKKGAGAYWGQKKNAKLKSNKKRRGVSKKSATLELEEPEEPLDSYSYHEA